MPFSDLKTTDYVLIQRGGNSYKTTLSTLQQEIGGAAGDGFAAGTKMVFANSSPPNGWTIDTANNDAALRVVTDSTGGTTGGSVGFTTAFQSHTVSFSGSGGTASNSMNENYTCSQEAVSVDGTTDSYLASGSVSIYNHSLSSSQNGSHSHNYLFSSAENGNVQSGPSYLLQKNRNTDGSGSGSGHSHSAVFSGNAHSHDLSFTRYVQPNVTVSYAHDHGSVSVSGSGTVNNAVKYNNVCIGVKQ